MGKNGVTGIIVGLEGPTIDRVFHHRPTVPLFVESFPDDLEPGDRVFLYVRGGPKVIDGEGVVSSVTRETLEQVRRIGSELCLSAQELEDRARASGRGDGEEVLILRLRDATKYTSPMRCSIPIPEDGLYMTAETFFRILKENE